MEYNDSNLLSDFTYTNSQWEEKWLDLHFIDKDSETQFKITCEDDTDSASESL